MANCAPANSTEKHFVHFEGLPFEPEVNQIIYYDPEPQSEIAAYIESHLPDIKSFFTEYNPDFQFCYLPEMTKQFADEQVRYQYPNWNGEPFRRINNDVLKPFLAKEDRDIGACLMHLYKRGRKDIFRYYPLQDISKVSFEDQLEHYETVLFLDSLDYDIKLHIPEESYSASEACYPDKDEAASEVRFSVSKSEKDTTLFPETMPNKIELPGFEKRIKYNLDDDFENQSKKILADLKDFLKKVQLQGISEFVLNCTVPVEKKLSRLVIDEDYNVILPDYNNLQIELGPLPKAVFLLFMKHEEGIVFKCLSDYREELERYYKAVTNRVTQSTIDNSLDMLTDPTHYNYLNEKCSVIKRAFVEHMDLGLAENYCITGKPSEVKRITLPRNLVEWHCNL